MRQDCFAMLDADAALDQLRIISSEFASFRAERGRVGETDTRVKIIDRILTQVLCWPESSLSREEHVDSGFIDYVLTVQGRRYLAVEAKREGVAFVLPTTSSTHKALRISGTLTTEPAIKAAVEQVRAYCDDGGIRYAIATNGYSWVVFRAIREDKPWREGLARVFPSLDYICEHFTEFWNLLSRGAIGNGSLDGEFGAPNRHPRQLLRVVDRLFNADLPLQRNRLHTQLHPLIDTVFEDIADQHAVEILQSCYVHSNSLRIVADDLNVVITDAIPKFLQDQGTLPVKQQEQDSGGFGILLRAAMPSRHGQLFLLLGGIGSGKTTFIKRYQRTVGAPLLNSQSMWFHIDFLKSVTDPADLERFVWNTVLAQLRERYASPYLETRKNIKKAFIDRIKAIEHTGLRGLRSGTDAYEDALSPYLARWQEDIIEYVPRLLDVGRRVRGVEIVAFFDNVDQLSPAYQAEIFLLAQRVTRTIGTISVVSLREESYYAANVQKTLTAYTNRRFHIASPRFRRMIGNRIRYALQSLEHGDELGQVLVPRGVPIDTDAIGSFLRIVEYSIFERNRNIALFIEALCFGNMRMALEMFTTFLASGATDVDKMLTIYRRDGAYFVAFHEFVKSIMLGDRKYYKESASPVMNLFDCSADRNSSHFTGLRILRFLLSRRGETSREGQGYYEIARLVSALEDVFDNREDVIRALNKMVDRQLLEVNTRSTESIDGASHARVTSAGWYYSRHLAGLFAYLDLVLQDTPLNDPTVERRLRDSVFEVDNLADRENEKVERMQTRFDRVNRFLQYLDEEERSDYTDRDITETGDPICDRIVPALQSSFDKGRAWIERRVRENRERYKEELTASIEDTSEEAELFELDIDEEDNDASTR